MSLDWSFVAAVFLAVLGCLFGLWLIGLVVDQYQGWRYRRREQMIKELKREMMSN
jgi:membrane protein YdbS with pleckstrin-like domain